jgi:asparagine synthase (glutamine-hydrolysing)
MGGLVGIVRLDGGPVGRAIVDRWKRGIHTIPSARVRSGDSWASAYSPPPYLQAESSEPQPFDLASGQVLFVEGRLDEPAAVAASLGLDARRSDLALIAAAYQQWGPAAHERLYGDFAVALWDAGKRTLTLARDALGTRALYYHFDGAAVWFATALHHLLALPEVPRDLDELGLADFMTRSSDARERTLYRHITRVPSGGSVSFREGSAREHRYWTLETIRPVTFARDEDYAEMARTLLDAAVKSRLPATGLVATTLSGGLDSTAVTATAARLLGGQRLTAFTRVAGAHDPYSKRFDEKALAGLVANRYANIDWVVVDDLHDDDRNLNPEWESAAMGLPVTAQAISWFEPIERRAAAIGARALLSGGWGNATLSGSGNGLCFEQVRKGSLVAAARDVALRARYQGKPVWPALRREMIACLEPRAFRRWRRERKSPWHVMAVFAPDFLRSVDYASHTDSIGHDILRSVRRTGRELRWEMMRRELVTDRLAFLRNRTPYEKVTPLRDRRMAEFTLGAPERQFQRNGVDRWLARRALADRLPAEVLAERGRGMQNGEWYHLASLHREQRAEAVERLANSPLASRVLDVPFLKTLIDTWPRNAEEAIRTQADHRHKLEFGLGVGAFLRWYEGSNG